MHRRRSAYTVAAAAALVVAAPLLTGCGSEQSKAGAAAVVDGERITVSQVQARSEAVREAQRSSDNADELIRATGRLNQDNLDVMINRRVIERAAEDEDIRVTRREVQEARAGDQKQVGGKAQLEQVLLREQSLAPSQIDEFYRTILLFNKLIAAWGVEPGTPQADKVISEKLVETAEGMDVTVNPRYGTWDAKSGRLTEGKTEWLKSPAQESQPGLLPPGN